MHTEEEMDRSRLLAVSRQPDEADQFSCDRRDHLGGRLANGDQVAIATGEPDLRFPGDHPYGFRQMARDTELKGFIVIVNKKSSTWAVQRDLWQGARGRRRLVRSVRRTIGRVGTMPLRVAGEEALEVIRLIQQGIDPNDPPPTRELTLHQAWQDYSEALTTRRRSSRTIDDFTYNLRYFREWADMTLAEIGANRAMMRDRHKKITKESGPYSANHAMRALRSTYNLALKVDDRLPANPVIAVIFNGAATPTSHFGK